MPRHSDLTRGRAGMADELDQIGHCASAARALDVPRMQRLLADLLAADWERPGVIGACRLALLRGISAGHFLRKTSGSNG